MKFILLLSLMMPLSLHAQKPRYRAAATHEDLVKTHRQAQQVNPMVKLPEAKGPAPATAEPIPSLLGRSDILSFGGLTTLVPKQAILNQPKNLATRIGNVQEGSKIVPWGDFYQNNRGWITTLEVTRAQAEGNEAIDEKVVESYRKSTNLVVATYQGGPISVVPLREPKAKESDKSQTNQVIKKP